jgi:C4-type Zn-finger protein
MTRCSYFHRDKKIPWIDDIIIGRCNVCMYRDHDDKCKLRTDNRTAFCHDYHYSSNNRVSMVLR